MMRKQFPFPLSPIESTTSTGWNPPPAPAKFQNDTGFKDADHYHHHHQNVSFESICSNYPESSSRARSSRKSTTASTPSTPRSYAGSSPSTCSQQYHPHHSRERTQQSSNNDVTRLSFDSIFSQFRRLPKKRHSSLSLVSSSCTTARTITATEEETTATSGDECRHSLMDFPVAPSTLTTHQRNKNLHLLCSWTDSGHYSRVKAMTIASILYNRKVSEGDIRAELLPKEKFAFKGFCSEIEDKLEIITRREPSRIREPFSERTLRKIWHLYALYTKALSDEIWDEGTAKSDITSRAIAHLVKRAIAGGSDDSCGNNYSTARSSISTPTLKPVDPLDSVNPVLASSLKDPIQAFLIVYGRYVSVGKVKVERLRKLLDFNEIAKEFFEKLVEPPENVDMGPYLGQCLKQSQCQQKWTSSGFMGYGGKSSNSDKRRKSKHHKRSSSLVPQQSSKVDEQGDTADNKDIIQSYYDTACAAGTVSCSPVVVELPPPSDNDVKSLQRKIQMLDGKKRICLVGCRYDVLPKVALSAGFDIVGENDLWNINWSDSPLAQEKIMQMRRVQDMYSVFWGLNAPLQKCNHFPGMYEICRKDRLGRNLNRLKRIFPGEYNFFPETFDLPTEQTDLLTYARRRKKHNITFIIKPECGCQGKGIFLLRNLKKLSPFAKCVCQLYIPHPFLIDGYKFDQRIYVLITCVDPLRLYIYDEGIARFATVKYEVPTDENLEIVFMHLTNYSLNKFSESYVREADGSKRTLSSIYQWMADNGHDVGKLIRDIDEIVVKTLLCAAPTLKHNYKTSFPKRDRGCSCFELLGFDILIDRHLNPYLLEVNHSPSFNLDLPVDHQVKTTLLKDMLNMVYLGDELKYNDTPQAPPMQPSKKKRNCKGKKQKGHKSPSLEDIETPEGVSEALQRQFKHEIKNKGQFRLIYSSDKPGRFHKLNSGEKYCGYNAVSATVPPQDRQMVVFDKDPEDMNEHKEIWKPPRTSSTLKITKKGQSYVETRLDVPDIINSPQNVQRFREIRASQGDKESSRHHHHRSSGGHRQLEPKVSKSKLKISSKNNSYPSEQQQHDDKDRGHRDRARRKSNRSSVPKVVVWGDVPVHFNKNGRGDHNKDGHY